MAANATAKKPAKAPPPKKPSPQPPSDTVWLQYHPWLEGLVGHLASWCLHLLVIGVGVLVVLAYAYGFIKHPTSLPVEPVLLAPGGGGTPEGDNNTNAGEHAPLKEGVHAEKDNPGNTTNPAPADRANLPADVAKKDEKDFDPNTSRPINEAPEAAKTFANLDKDVSNKLPDGVDPSKGTAGPGTGTGTGPGNGPGTGPGTGPGQAQAKTVSEHQRNRWREISINTLRGVPGDFLARLKNSDTIIAVSDDPFPTTDDPASKDALDRMRFTVFTLSQSQKKDGATVADLQSLNRGIFWFVSRPEDIDDLARPLGLAQRPRTVICFMSPDLQAELARQEKAYTHKEEADLERTVDSTSFKVDIEGPGRWVVQVTDVKYFK